MREIGCLRFISLTWSISLTSNAYFNFRWITPSNTYFSPQTVKRDSMTSSDMGVDTVNTRKGTHSKNVPSFWYIHNLYSTELESLVKLAEREYWIQQSLLNVSLRRKNRIWKTSKIIHLFLLIYCSEEWAHQKQGKMNTFIIN